MGIGIWQLILVILILSIYPLLVIIFERTENTIPRKDFGAWLCGLVVVSQVGNIMEELANDITIAMYSSIFCSVIFIFFFYRRLVWRARDAGASKIFVYLACIPLINLFIWIYLGFRKSALPVAETGEN